MPQSESSQRKEYMGDGLIMAIARLYLYEKFPHICKWWYGGVTNDLVSNVSLSVLGKLLHLRPVTKQKKGMARAFEIWLFETYKKHGFEECKAQVFKLYSTVFSIPHILDEAERRDKRVRQLNLSRPNPN